jgi:molybdopterin synthase sulfur carrier subunit
LPTITIKALGTFVDYFGFRQMELTFSGKTIAGLLDELAKQVPKLPSHIFEDERKEKVKGFVKILINGRGIEHLGNLQAMLKEGDVIAIAPPIGGGGTNKLPKKV